MKEHLLYTRHSLSHKPYNNLKELAEQGSEWLEGMSNIKELVGKIIQIQVKAAEPNLKLSLSHYKSQVSLIFQHLFCRSMYHLHHPSE